LLSAALYKVSEDYGVPVIETAQVHSAGESYEPIAMKGLSLWAHNIIRLDYVSPRHRKLSVEKPNALQLEFRIGEGGIEWLNC
jgi:DNA repair protein RadB